MAPGLEPLELVQIPVEQARHFLLSTASLGILSYEHERIDQPAIELWNTAACDSCPLISDLDASMKRRGIDRWENEGGVKAAAPQC